MTITDSSLPQSYSELLGPLQELVESTIDLEEMSSHNYVIKPVRCSRQPSFLPCPADHSNLTFFSRILMRSSRTSRRSSSTPATHLTPNTNALAASLALTRTRSFILRTSSNTATAFV